MNRQELDEQIVVPKRHRLRNSVRLSNRDLDIQFELEL